MTRAACLVLLLLLPGCGSHPERGVPEPTALELRAAEALAQGRPAEALELFGRASQQGRGSFVAALGAARASLSLAAWGRADAWLEQAMAHCPRTAQSYVVLGRTLLEAARLRGGDKGREHAILAGTFFVHARRLEPDLPGLTYLAGLSKYLGGEIEESLVFLASALDEDPTQDVVLEALVTALRRLDRKAAVRAVLDDRVAAGTVPPGLLDDLAWAASAPPPGGGH